MNKTSEALSETLLLEMSSELLCIIGFDGNFIHMTHAWETYFGYTLQEFKSKGLVDFVHPEDVETTLMEIQKLVDGKAQSITINNRYISKKGVYKSLTWEAKLNHEHIYAVAKAEGKSNESLNIPKHYHDTLYLSNEYIIIASDKRGCVTSFNKAATSTLGYSPDEVMGLAYQELFFRTDTELPAPAAHSSPVPAIPEAIFASKGNKGFSTDDRRMLQRKDGSCFPVRLSIEPILDELGEALGYLTIAIDITQQQHITEMAREKEQQLMAFIQHAPTSIALFDKEMKYLRASNCWVKENLKDVDEYIGKKNATLSPDSPWIEYEQKALQGENFKNDEYCITRSNGTKEWICWEIRPWMKADASIGGVIVTTENITFRKVAHAAVTAKSQMLNGILRNLPVIIYKINADGMFTECVGAGLKQMGLYDNEASGRPAKLFFPAFTDTLDILSDGANNVFRTNGRYQNEEWHFENYLFPDNVNNKGIIGFAFDISDKVIKEREMQAARDRAETADKYKTQFLANMSHEIRTPLNAIIGFAEIFEKKNLSTEQHEHLHNITSSGNLLLKLIGDILDLSKIEEGKLSVDPESFNIKELLTSDLLPYKYNANKKGLDFTLKFDSLLPVQIIADPNKIKQVVINLIGNAMKFTQLGGITVEIGVESKDSDKEEVHIRFAISDTGIGIPTEKQSRIFETFTQADSSIVREYGGSGLGLSIVKQLVHLMGGCINITSPTNTSIVGGPGSCFWFVLPCKISTRKGNFYQEEKQEIKPFEVPVNILVAEDNPMNQALAEVILKRLNCHVTFAENGEQAISLYEKQSFDLILMDVQMPVMNGFQATESLRKKYGSAIPIVGLTANVYKEDVLKCLQSGMDDYLGKPYTEAQIYKIIKQWSCKRQRKNIFTNLEFLENSGNGNMQFVKSMVQIFFKENEEFIKSLETGLLKKDSEDLKQALHKAKSCYKMVGINSADSLFKAMEENFGGCDWNVQNEIVDKIKILSQSAVNELQEEI